MYVCIMENPLNSPNPEYLPNSLPPRPVGGLGGGAGDGILRRILEEEVRVEWYLRW